MQTPVDTSLHGLRLAVAGPGRVGTSLARWAVAAGASLEFVVRRSPATARDSLLPDAPTLGFEAFPGRLGQGAAPDVVLLTTSDAALAPIAASWAAALDASGGGPEPRPVILHSAGSLDAGVLDPLHDVGIAVGSLHPLRAFPRVLERPEPRGVFAVDGDEAALAIARRLVAAWHGVAFEITGDRRRVYHLAASLAAGGVVTVLAAVAHLMAAADLPDQLLDGYLRLLRGAVEPVDRPEKAAASITGPAARGDAATLAEHLRSLRAVAPELEPLVQALWSGTALLSGASEAASERSRRDL